MNTHLTRAHIEQVLAALRDHPLEPIITVALATGMRRDELLALTWQDLDLELRQVRVRTSKMQRDERLIPLSESLVAVLRHHAAHQREARLHAGNAWQERDLVFCGRRGEALSPQQLVQVWYKLCEQAGLPRLRFHELRLARLRALCEDEAEDRRRQ